ncbi:hypothetical protein RM190_11180 [Paracoccus sp. CPCC 101403]|uniref:Uncharacterized protein n=1 Tax=Paracoccus broussonetiae TaxID=3075834 RepID=A0ABU3EDW4_9RHOB|nr:hypothetical protein [Paracoccus sp. CPCC 101403]MDT1062427.1 hypothetical protein [Paracoccus sp. CPCC 101403]
MNYYKVSTCSSDAKTPQADAMIRQPAMRGRHRIGRKAEAKTRKS